MFLHLFIYFSLFSYMFYMFQYRSICFYIFPYDSILVYVFYNFIDFSIFVYMFLFVTIYFTTIFSSDFQQTFSEAAQNEKKEWPTNGSNNRRRWPFPFRRGNKDSLWWKSTIEKGNWTDQRYKLFIIRKKSLCDETRQCLFLQHVLQQYPELGLSS